MKKIIILALIFTFILCGCKKAEVNNNKSTIDKNTTNTVENTTESEKPILKTHVKKVEIPDDINSSSPVICAVYGDIFLLQYNEKNSDSDFYAYNEKTKEMTKICSVEGWEVSSNKRAAFSDGKYFVSFSFLGSNEIKTYMIDAKNIKSDVFNVHNNENKIVDNKAINNNQLLQFRIEVLNNNYRYLLLLADKNQREFKTILQKGDLSSGESLNDDTDIIECYSACDDIIYTCETSVNSDEYYLCTYDLNGKRLTKERMYALENIEDMKGYMMWDMEVIGNDMIYFDSLSNRRITAEKSENGFKVIDELNNLRLLKDYKCVDKE